MRLIDAETLVRRAIEHYKPMMGTDIGHGMGVITSLITDAPTIEAEPVRHGRWESIDDNSWRCSECRRENCYAYDETSRQFTDFYCPNCGTKMDLKEG